MKKCNTCGEDLPKDNFYPQKNTKDNLTARCKPCTRARSKKYQEAHRSERAEYLKTYYKENKDLLIARSSAKYWANVPERRLARRANYLKHRDRIILYQKRYYLANKDKYNSYSGLRSSRVRQATPPWADTAAILAVYEQRLILSQSTGVLYHVDHIIPLHHPLVCGLHVEYNLQIITAEENLRKSNKFTQHFH